MINLQLYYQSENLIQALSHSLAGHEQVTLITPNPALADAARLRFASLHSKVETITIAKFLKDELTLLLGDSRLENFRSKSELSLLLGSLWKMRRPNDSYELFKRCFQLLTDFRSFTMNDSVLSTIMENFDENLAQSVIEFHILLNQMDIIDEHRSYFLLAERLREGNLPILYPTNRTFVFWGFDFLTGSQVDLLNAIAIRDDIFIPFAALAYDEAKSMDWIKWLTVDPDHIQLIDSPYAKGEIKTFLFAKNYLAKTLKSIQQNHFYDKSIDLILGCKNLTDDYVTEIPFANYCFKVSVNIFDEKLKALRHFILEHLHKNNTLSIKQVLTLLDDYTELCIKKQDFRALKTLSVFKEVILEWNDLTENNESIGIFDIAIILDAVALDLPRSSLFNSGDAGSFGLKTLKNIEQDSQTDIRLLCVTSEYDSIKSSVIQYAQKVEQYLMSIGPIRRSEFEFLVLKAKVHEFLMKKNTYLVVEHGLFERDLGWNNIVSEFKLIPQNLIKSNEAKKIFFNPVTDTSYKLSTLSASKLQAYIDCPRKFYLSYVLKQRPNIELPGDLNLMQLGLIEHKVIEEYLKKYSAYEEQLLNTLIAQVLESYQTEKRIVLAKAEEYFLEIKAYCSEIIKELVIFNNFLGLNFFFEKQLTGGQDIKVQGSIDCYAENALTTVILDFKRGAGSIPSQVGLKNFEKIQLWFYLNNLKKEGVYQGDKKLIWGYVNLSDLESSLIYCSDSLLRDQIKNLNLKMFTKLYAFDDVYHERLTTYENFETEAINTLKQEDKFNCHPKNEQLCKYCEVANVCPRAPEVHNV